MGSRGIEKKNVENEQLQCDRSDAKMALATLEEAVTIGDNFLCIAAGRALCALDLEIFRQGN